MTSSRSDSCPHLAAWNTPEHMDWLHELIRQNRLDRIREYLWIGGQRMPARKAAARLGVHERTVRRWRAWLRQHPEFAREAA